MPTLSPGYVKVSISDNGCDFMEIAEYLKITGSISVATLSPSRGTMGIVENSFVDVHGAGFVNTSVILCKFGNAISHFAEFMSETLIRCSVPHVNFARTVDVSLSLDGVHFYKTQTTYEYLNPATITRMQPRKGPGSWRYCRRDIRF